MPGRYRPRVYFLAVCAAILLFASAASPAAGSYFKNDYFPVPYSHSLYTSPVLVDCSLPGTTVTELTGVDDIVVIPESTLNVSLMETDPHLDWTFGGADGVQYTGNSLIETYPVRHLFKLQANSSCIIRFKMADDRTGKTLKTFGFGLVVAPPRSGLGWPALSPDLTPSFGWPPALKF